MSRADCIRLAIFGLLLVVGVISTPAGGQEQATTLAPINSLRDDDELAPVAASAELDRLAERYLKAMLDARCLCPVADGASGDEQLLADVRAALGRNATVVDAGLVVGYDRSPETALTTAIHDPANGSAILGMRMSLVGIATGVVEGGEDWLEPPPGGIGPEIELSGYALAVIVMAGSEE